MPETNPSRSASAHPSAAPDRAETRRDRFDAHPLIDQEAPLVVTLDPGTAGTLTVRVAGDLDVDTVDLLSRTLDQVSGHRFTSVAIDLSQLRFCDSSGIRALLIAHAEAERLGRRMYVVNPRPFVRRVFELTGVASLLGLPPDLGA